MTYKRTLDRMTGHDYPGVYSHGFVQFELDELELGARAAMAIDDPDQAWWELIGNHLLEKEMNEAARDSRNQDDVGMGGVSP